MIRFLIKVVVWFIVIVAAIAAVGTWSYLLYV